jgi:metal-responsive CopG/Arc/MetJ family transcriptional regulator
MRKKLPQVTITLDNWSKTYLEESLQSEGYVSRSKIIPEALRIHQERATRVEQIKRL